MSDVDLSAFMRRVIERVGREPDSINDRIYCWEVQDTLIELIVSSKLADIEVDLHVNRYSSEPGYYHHYELADTPQWDGMSIGVDGSMWTYKALVESVGFAVAATINMAEEREGGADA